MIKKVLFIIILSSFNMFSMSNEGNKYVDITFYTTSEKINPDANINLIVEIAPKKGWHTYWLNAGDSGLPTSIDLTLPEGFKIDGKYWEYPHRISFDGFYDFGYDGKHYAAFRISAPHNLPDNMKLKAKISFLVCNEKCIPGLKEISLDMNKDLKVMKMTEYEDISLKFPANEHRFRINASIIGDKLFLKLNKAFNMNSTINSMEFFPLEEGIFLNGSKGEFKNNDDSYQLVIDLDKNREKNPETIKAVLVAEPYFFNKYYKKAIEIEVNIENK